MHESEWGSYHKFLKNCEKKNMQLIFYTNFLNGIAWFNIDVIYNNKTNPLNTLPFIEKQSEKSTMAKLGTTSFLVEAAPLSVHPIPQKGKTNSI